MDLRELGSDGILNLSHAPGIGGAREILLCAQRMEEEESRAMRERPEMNDTDLRRDVRYRLGFMAGLNRITSLPEQAKAIISQATGGQDR